MTRIKLRIQAVLVGMMLLFFIWLAVSWLEIGMHSPLEEQPSSSRYNAFVVLTGQQTGEPHRAA